MIRLLLLRAIGLSAMCVLGACHESGGGPRTRIEQFTGCHVPTGAVQVHDLLEGDDSAWSIHAHVVLPHSRFEDFLASCDLDVEDLKYGFPHAHLTPHDHDGSPVRWWNVPGPAAVAGVSSQLEGRSRDVLVVERDTDVAVFIVAHN